MSKRWYGSINNRIEEGHQFCPTIEVGTGMTEYMWSDRHAYEVTRVESQEHVWVRRMNAKNKAAYDNTWTYTSNQNAPEIELVKRFNGWNKLYIYSKKSMLETINKRLQENRGVSNSNLSLEARIKVEYDYMVAMSNLSESQRRRLEEGKEIKKYEKWNNISFGIMDEYYDWEF